ncbi:MAG TPA: hypothetical protein PLZ51_02165, partial [Aggregatilineales bacterium]|nr:hypothetical protein [Aggregatilineales bacterium]
HTGEYYGEIYECYHFVGNDALELTPEPTPEITPTEEVTATPEVTVTPEVSETPTEITPETPVVPEATPTEEVPTGDCGAYSVDADGFPIINLSSQFCGGDSEGQVVNFAPIETGGGVCLPEALYHSNATGTWDIFRTGSNLAEPQNLTNGAQGIVSMAPTRSPNGRYVTFVSNADGDWEIYLIDIEGEGKLMQLTNNESAIDL